MEVREKGRQSKISTVERTRQLKNVEQQKGVTLYVFYLKKIYSKFDVHKEKRRLLCEMLREETDFG